MQLIFVEMPSQQKEKNQRYQNDGSKAIMKNAAYNEVKTKSISENLEKNVKTKPCKEAINTDSSDSQTISL